MAATIAFGMGVDCSNVKQIIHWGPASDLDSYVQGCGVAGHNEDFSSALLYVKNSDLRNISEDMKVYCSDQAICRRTILLSYFNLMSENAPVTSCSCCDICAISCVCSNCKCKDFPFALL